MRAFVFGLAAAISLLAAPLLASRPAGAQSQPADPGGYAADPGGYAANPGADRPAFRHRRAKRAPLPEPVQGPATVGIMTGEIDGTFIRIGTDLADVLNSDQLRVLPLIGKGSLQNLDDLLHVKGVDLALAAADSLAYAQQHNLFPGLRDHIQYIAKLYDQEVHVLAGPDIQSLADLAHKTVNADVKGSGTFVTASVLFEKLGIPVTLTNDSPTVGLQKLKDHQVSAIVYVIGKPGRLFASLPADSGLHLLPVPPSDALLQAYLPGQLTHADYPALIPDGQTVDTIAVQNMLAVFTWPPGSDRYRNMVRFIDAFFTKFPDLLKPPHHPKWHDVNLTAEVPGWTRYAPAQAWLNAHVPAPPVASAAPRSEQARFDQYLGEKAVQLTPAQKAALFQQFQQWQQSH